MKRPVTIGLVASLAAPMTVVERCLRQQVPQRALHGNIRFRKPRCSGMNDAHSMASSLVAHWRPKPILEVHEARTIEHEFFRLTFPGPYLVAVTFYRVEGRPDLMRVRSTNWRTQDEPNGIFRIEDCREFYRRLRRAGFG